MKKTIVTVLLLLAGAAAWAVGKFELYAPAAKINAHLLTNARTEYLVPEAKGPSKSVHVRYQDTYAGKKRTWYYSAQSYVHPSGSTSYVVVVTEQIGKKLERHMAFASISPIPPETGEETPDHELVYSGLTKYLKSIQIEKKLQPGR